ncbi:ADAMTS-like protein 3 isoform X1 [Pleurodeles waltl]
MASGKLSWLTLTASFIALFTSSFQDGGEQSQGAYFLPEFALSPQGSFLEDTTGEQFLTYRFDDQSSRTARSDEEKDSGWDAWGTWSDCSRTCGGGASYSLRRCLNGRNCEGRNIRYRTCSNNDCPPEAGDFRAQQCSAHNDVKYQGQYYEWLPVYNDLMASCALKCQAFGKNFVVELAPKVLDGTRCNTESPDMCISGICQAVGCDRQLGSNAKEDNCGVCAGDGSTCRLVRGQTKSHVSSEKREETVIAVPHGSRSVRITVKGPAHVFIESKTLQGEKGEHSFSAPGVYVIENTTLEFQKSSERETIKIPGPLRADFIVKTRYVAPKDSLVQFFFYQPISHQWRQTDFFPCTVTCGGGYQLNSAECVDIRLNRVVPDHYCQYYPENKKPKPKLKECNMEPCPSSDGFKEIMPYDHFQPLPRWEYTPWTSCSVSCGGGIQRRSIICVEETMHGEILQVEEWKCMYAPKPPIMQTCNLFDCPKWTAMEWSQCTVTCGRGLRYRVVLCNDHRGQHTGGCNPQLKPHIKEECIVAVPCYKPREKVPLESKLPWFKQALEMEETREASEQPMFIPDSWSSCSTSCGPGFQVREVKCRILLTFTQTEMELPDEECEDDKPPTKKSCHLRSCDGESVPIILGSPGYQEEHNVIYDWEYIGFTPCSATCQGGKQDAIAMCLHTESKKAVNETLCDFSKRPPAMTQICNAKSCPPRWQTSPWSQCSATCGVGIQTRNVLCPQSVESGNPKEQDCRDKKPFAFQACNQIDCPPDWHAEEWQQCTRTCGGGTQNRKVNCKMLMADGSLLNKPDGHCNSVRPATHKPCSKTDCPPQITVGEWSQCSVSCGVGTQRRKLVCYKITARGQQIIVNGSLCSGLPVPLLVRTCQVNDCNRTKQHNKQKLPEMHGMRGPQILSLHRVYIQTRQEKRINFTIGSRAYLFPKTSILIKCPVRRFPKSFIQWDKDGKPLHSSKRIGITKSGSLKIHNLEASDIGVYTCAAGSVYDTFVLKLIGADNRLLDPPRFEKRIHQNGGVDHNEASSIGSKWNKVSTMWKMWSKKNDLYLDDSRADDETFIRNLETLVTNSAEAYGSHEFENKRLEAAVLEGAYSMDTVQFEALIKNMSQLGDTGEVNDDLASQVISHLLAELSRPLPTIRKWKGSHEQNVSDLKLTGKTPNESEIIYSKSMEKPLYKHKGPVIQRRKQSPAISFNASLNVFIGHNAFLTNATEVLTVHCDVEEAFQPKISWTRDGAEVQPSEKFTLKNGKLQIWNPTKEDTGVYGCAVLNDFGSDMETSSLLYAEEPAILSRSHTITFMESSSESAVAGDYVLARKGSTVRIACPVKGLPQPKVTWFRKDGTLGNQSFVLANGTLLLKNMSSEREGIYTCRAANALGNAVAMSHLRLSEVHSESNQMVLKVNEKKRILMASGVGINSTAKSGVVLRIGCPLQTSHRNRIHWLLQNEPIQEVKDLEHRILVLGRVLEVGPLSAHHAGQYKCWTLHNTKTLSAWVNVIVVDYKWEHGEWKPCSASCGNSGTQLRERNCVNDKGQRVSEAMCGHLQQPVANEQPCNVQDCGARWVTSPWAECSASCGDGFQQRHITCQQMTGNGSVLVLPSDACRYHDRPPGRKPCSQNPCAGWIAQPWGKCSNRCVGKAVGLQHRHIQCQHHNRSVAPDSHCQDKRPVSRRNCSSEMCDVYWREGAWRPCTAACGNGIQSRRVDCVHMKNNKTVADQYCSWRRRPITWQHCSATSCGKGECKDTTHYCTFVKHLKLCFIDLYKQRCCESCREA